ncbi:hypothetical protein GcM1_216027 [Golovinomyces cichoracearum]|uniref:Uncharacterized protein n=1 Tax=Golovinomyces cichoracearum TaxID=62708 RepID=A0A420ITC7_9PEZI|nr:hypothetical protein GcM1_216027 [Golovinomyces cichoracearum]
MKSGERLAEYCEVTGKNKKTRQLNEINGRDGQGPVDYKDMLAQIGVNISILDLMQIRPDAAKVFKLYSTRRNQKRGKKKSQSNKATANLLVSSDKIAAPQGIKQRDCPFRLLDATIICPKLKTKTILNMGATQADQGSDLNLISDLLVSTLNLEKREIPGLGDFMMQAADGNLATLRTFASFKLGVTGIWRDLYSVKVNINIFENCIAIWDPVYHPKDGKRQIIRYVVWKSSPHHHIMLVPLPDVMAEVIEPRALDPHTHVDHPEEIESPKNESEESEDDEESESDEELNNDLNFILSSLVHDLKVLNPLTLYVYLQSYVARKFKQTDHPEINFIPTPIQTVSNNSPYTFTEALLLRDISHCKYTVFPFSDLYPPSTDFNCQSHSLIETHDSSLTYPTKRRPPKRSLSKSPQKIW